MSVSESMKRASFSTLMKRFREIMRLRIKDIIESAFSAKVFLWFYPLLLIVPNIALDFTESYNWVVKICNALLPFGIYLLLMSFWRNIGRTACLLLFIFLFYGAFQIVLLFLYGESIIAVDMFLNVATTSVEEATELLGNLASAVITVCLVYIPTLLWGICLAVKKSFPSSKDRLKARTIASIITATGLIFLVASYVFVPDFDLTKQIFPANVMRNTVTAIKRTVATEHYHTTSSGFTYGAVSTHPVNEKEIYVLVVGETSRADNWQLMGYSRQTNPKLSKRNDIIAFPKVLTESNTTHKSVPMLLSWLSADNFKDSIYTTKGIITAFKEAGYTTAYLSNQARNHAFIDFFAEEADKTIFLKDDYKIHYDSELIDLMKEFISQSENDKLFLILHSYGSHFNYVDRYPASASYFQPDNSALAEAKNRAQLINAYDNTIVQTDLLLNQIIEVLENEDCLAAMLYVSDHGEDIFDDERERFLHASPVPTYYQIHVPMVLWMSKILNEKYPDNLKYAKINQDKDISSSKVFFNTILKIAEIHTKYMNYKNALTDSTFQPTPRVYINDYNEQVEFDKTGLRNLDFNKLNEKGISF